MARAVELAEAVAAELSDYGAEVSLAPEFALGDVKDMKVVVVPAGVAHNLIARGHHEDVVKVQVGILKRASPEEVVDLVSFAEYLAVGFLGRILCGSARCMKAENAPLYVPEHLRERRQFTGVVELTFKEIASGGAGRI